MQAKAKTQASTRVKEPTLVDHIKRHLAPAVVAAGLGWVLFNVLDREPPFTVIDVSVTPRTVNAGSDAQINWDLKWRRTNCQITSSPELVTPSGVVFKFVSRDVPRERMIQNPGHSFHVPWTFLTGTTSYRSTITYRCNWVQRIWPVEVEMPNVPFDVVGLPGVTSSAPETKR